MALSKASIQALRHVVLLPPRQDNERKYFLRSWQGTVQSIGEDEQLTQDRPILYFRSKYRVDFENLRKEVKIALRKGRVTAASEELAEAAIAMAVAYRQVIRMDAVNELFEDTLSVQAAVFLGVPDLTATFAEGGTEAFFGFRFGRFTVGVDALRVHNSLFGNEESLNASELGLSGRPGLWFMREPLDCTLLSVALDQRIRASTRDYYFELLGGHLGFNLRGDILADQRICAALNVPTFDVERLLYLHGLRIDVAFGQSATTRLTLLNYESRVIPSGIDRLGDCDRWLKSNSKIPFGSAGIDKTLLKFAEYVQKANAHDVGARPSDAFIHYVFALDLLLGGRDTTRNVSNRASVIYACSSSKSFQNVRKDLLGLYDRRSKYVHQGLEIPIATVEEIADVCRSVMECLLRVRNLRETDTEDYLEQIWFRGLDYLAAAMYASADVPDEHFEKYGVIPPGSEQSKWIH